MVCRAARVDGISEKVSDVAGIRPLIAKQQIYKRSMVERRGDVEYSGSHFSELTRITKTLEILVHRSGSNSRFFSPRSSSPPQQTSAVEVAIRPPAALYTPTIALQCLAVLENEELPNYPDTLPHSIPTHSYQAFQTRILDIVRIVYRSLLIRD